ncbi:MAG: ABC transporter substrate-binding protein [Alphaproteobacteria bacterium]
MRRLLAPILMACAALAQPAAAKELRFAFQADVASLDPVYFNEAFTQGWLNNIQEGLVRWDNELKIEPALATEWRMDDPVTWTFKLRRGVKFHDGRPMTADDVLFTYERAMGPTSDYRSTLTEVAKVEKVDDYTVRFTTKGPYPILPNTIVSIFILNREWAKENDATGASSIGKNIQNYAHFNANGTGPFKVVSRRVDQQTELAANPDWWDKPTHNLTRAVFLPIKNPATRVASLLSGQVDMIWPLPLQDIPRVERSAGYKVVQRPSEWIVMLGMDQRHDELQGSSVKGRNPFKDVRVREAVYRAIDVASIRDKVMRGLSVPTALPLARTTWGYDQSLDVRVPFDPDRAKALLAEAGYPDGFDFTLHCPNDRFINDEQICVALVPMLARIGIKATLSVETRVKHFTKLRARAADMFLVGWAAASVKDGHNTLNLLLATSDGTRGMSNAGQYSDRGLDDLITRIGQELDVNKRRALFSQAWKHVRDDFAILPLHSQPAVWAMRDNIDMLQLADDNIRLWRVNIR